MDRAHARRSRSFAAATLALLLVAGVPAAVAAHPLGNFTINHHAGLRVEPDRILIDLVIDHAEVPAFQERRALDADDDGEVSDAEVAAGRLEACEAVRSDLDVRVDGAGLAPRLVEAGLAFPPGVGGLPTMRLVCGYEIALPTPIGDAPTEIAFTDGSFADRIGWREIVARGSGVTLAAVDGELRETSPSARLTAYPEARIASPLDDRGLMVLATSGGEVLPPLDIPDAEPVTDAAPTAPAPGETPAPGAVPGGIEGGELPGIFRTADLTPVLFLVALLTAAGLGAGHALTPGHGKTLMAAYLVGTRGTPAHALALGLSVSLSHTLGILVLAGLVVGAADVLPPEVLLRGAPLGAALSILAIGAWMLAAELRRRGRRRVDAHDHAHDHEEGQAHQHEHPHEHAHEHTHGPIRHSHAPDDGTTITWRSLFALGLAGGLIPSTSALLILLGSIAAGRPTFGFVLVVAFGLGMAAVMTTIGIVLVLARGRLDRLPSGGGVGRFRAAVPLAAAALVFGFGIVLTIQAIGGTLSL